MNAAEKIAHAAERKAFEAMLDSLIRKSQTKDVCTVANDFVNMVQKIHSSVWTPETFEMLHQIANDPDSKWAHYAERLLRECDPYLLRTFLTAAAYEGGFRGFQQARANSEKYDCNIPWIVLMDPTSACNMRCVGCWAAEYGHKQNLTFEEMDRVLTEGAELGTHACLFTGGEPLMRKADIFRLCEKHRDIAFHAFTNGTLIDQAFCDELKRVGNFIVSVSIEGFEDANDGRRGAGHFEKALAAMDLMHKNHIPFGVSICYTSKNYKVVTSDEFLDMLISKGCFFAWYFHYMPVGMGATTDLLLNPEQRAYMKDRVREIRGLTGGKEIFAIDFQNDGEFTGGCIAGGKLYCHINAAGDVEPCVFIHYSGANIREKSFLECLQQPLFKEYRKGQPFNNNHLRPCPMLENPEYLPQMVARSGAHSTDLEAPESVEHLCGKCKAYAAFARHTGVNGLCADLIEVMERREKPVRLRKGICGAAVGHAPVFEVRHVFVKAKCSCFGVRMQKRGVVFGGSVHHVDIRFRRVVLVFHAGRGDLGVFRGLFQHGAVHVYPAEHAAQLLHGNAARAQHTRYLGDDGDNGGLHADLAVAAVHDAVYAAHEIIAHMRE